MQINEFYDHPSELHRSETEKIAETIRKISTLIGFYTENLELVKETSNSLEYNLIPEKHRHLSCVIELEKSNQIKFHFKTTNEKYFQNTEKEGFLTKKFEYVGGHIRLIGNPEFGETLKAVTSFYDALNYCMLNGGISEVKEEFIYYVGLNYYADHPFNEAKYDMVIQSLESAKDILLVRPTIEKYFKVIEECHSVSSDLLNNAIELINKEQLMLNELGLKHVGILAIAQVLREKLEKNKIDQKLYEYAIARLRIIKLNSTHNNNRQTLVSVMFLTN